MAVDAQTDAQTDGRVTEPEPAEPGLPELPELVGDLVVVEDLLVEEVSIDGMCGVY